MDTKLKNNHKRGNLLTVIVLLISSVGMLLFYPAFSSYITDQDQKEMRKEEQMLDMLDPKTVVISVSNTRTDDCPAASVIQMVRERGCALSITDAVPDGDGRVSNHPALHFDL